jgi:putative phosphoesterase
MTRIGVISDTHGVLRPQALDALAGCERILHAGDIGNVDVLEALSAFAPVAAVRGNNDRGEWAADLPDTLWLRVENIVIHVLHDVGMLNRASFSGARVVVFGHSHRPGVREQDGLLYVNPGSAGPRRFRLPVTVAHLVVDGDRATAQIVGLAVAAARPSPRRTRHRVRQ